MARKQLAAKLVQAGGLRFWWRACECDGCTPLQVQGSSGTATLLRRPPALRMDGSLRRSEAESLEERSSTVALLDRIFQRQKRQRKRREAAFMWSMAMELTSGSALSVPRSDSHRPSIAKLSLPERMTPPHPGRQHQCRIEKGIATSTHSTILQGARYSFHVPNHILCRLAVSALEVQSPPALRSLLPNMSNHAWRCRKMQKAFLPA